MKGVFKLFCRAFICLVLISWVEVSSASPIRVDFQSIVDVAEAGNPFSLNVGDSVYGYVVFDDKDIRSLLCAPYYCDSAINGVSSRFEIYVITGNVTFDFDDAVANGTPPVLYFLNGYLNTLQFYAQKNVGENDSKIFGIDDSMLYSEERLRWFVDSAEYGAGGVLSFQDVSPVLVPTPGTLALSGLAFPILFIFSRGKRGSS